MTLTRMQTCMNIVYWLYYSFIVVNMLCSINNKIGIESVNNILLNDNILPAEWIIKALEICNSSVLTTTIIYRWMVLLKVQILYPVHTVTLQCTLMILKVWTTYPLQNVGSIFKMTLFCGSTPADVNPLLSDLNKLIRNRLTLLYSDPRACILQNF